MSQLTLSSPGYSCRELHQGARVARAGYSCRQSHQGPRVAQVAGSGGVALLGSRMLQGSGMIMKTTKSIYLLWPAYDRVCSSVPAAKNIISVNSLIQQQFNVHAESISVFPASLSKSLKANVSILKARTVRGNKFPRGCTLSSINPSPRPRDGLSCRRVRPSCRRVEAVWREEALLSSG